MIKQLRLKYFQRHEDLTVNFGPGLVALRARNEGGKSTLIRGIMYALYGSRALPASISDIVTWGRDERDLKVELDIFLDGTDYTFTRSKAGAEVLADGKVFVTGQTEVSNFAGQLMGADLNTANKLMVANQGNLRGALEAGPKAAAEMVENLADFELFDTLLDRASERLMLGNDTYLKQKLEEAQSQLEALSAQAPDTSAYEKVVCEIPIEIERLETQIKDKLEPDYEAARRDFERAKNNRSTYDLLSNNLKRTESALAEAKTQKIAAEQRAKPVDTSNVEALKERLKLGEKAATYNQIHNEMVKLNKTFPDTYWQDTVDSLHEAIGNKEKDVASLTDDITSQKSKKTELNQKLHEKQRLLQEDSHCNSCGQLLQNHEEIAKRNAEIQVELEQIRKEIAGIDYSNLQVVLEEAKDELDTLNKVLAQARPFDAFILKHSNLLRLDFNSVPTKIDWADPSLLQSVDTDAIENEIRTILKADEDSKAAAAKAKALEGSIADYELQVKDLQAQLDDFKLDNVEAFQTAQNDTYMTLSRAKGVVETLKDEVREAQTQIRLLTQEYEQKQETIKGFQEQVEQAENAIKEMAFNNNLVKRLRELRPTVANQLWNMILAAVSHMFTQMRGVKSHVTRDKDGFKVNGESIDTLSGSTLDLLGLSIRVALVKTFIPNCSFLVMDEAFAACDANRTIDALAFTQTLDISQVILITHEEISSQVADAVVEL